MPLKRSSGKELLVTRHSTLT